MIVLALLVQGLFMTLAFLLGKGVSFKRKKKTPDEIQKDKDNEVLRTMLENIDNYDGTGYGQKDIPYE